MYKPGIDTINLNINLPVEVVDFLRESNPNVPVPQMCAAIVCDTVTRIVQANDGNEPC